MSKPSDEIHGVIHEHAKRLVQIIDEIGDDEVASNEHRKRPSKVIMTGGLAQNKLFYGKVESQLRRERLGSICYPYAAVDTWNVVAIGAALFRHQIIPVNRQMKEHEPQDHAMQNSGL
ncbi:unnamed protein product [Clonostachys rosea f. rosea IK726]|uniref:Uncharacterized protein n=1 Tax=Clonostachys rosea f. rosea IK726 TaxID=1349383 RepID=A0ACA9TA29_BIOOC|nr:unnamed protein product [Clonostachys rosea f. rosea IK726]